MLIIKRRSFLSRNLREVFFFLYTPIQKRYNKFFKPKTSGVKVVVINQEGKYLLVRVGYGARRWAWPGGKIDRGETALLAAERELKEESSLEIKDLKAIGSKEYSWEGKRDTVYFFAGVTNEVDLVIDGQEIIDAGWFDLKGLPKPLSSTVPDGIYALNNPSS